MIAGLYLKICGLTSLGDAGSADKCGADYLGFILYPKSPRHLSLDEYVAMAGRLPERKRVAVMVEPSAAELARAAAAGFDIFQIHFRHDLAPSTVAGWAETVGSQRLWLAPKLPPGVDVAEALLAQAEVFLLDTFQADTFGGSGRTGDWPKFARLQQTHPDKSWILSGGLNPENISAALQQSGARFIDVNSGVESAPGKKDPEKLDRLVSRLQAARGQWRT
ncbi:MAG: phosphoribosylanthranilate isomerase [Opitutaceae bacterium]|nr:phosphoribosylanthranilate isomerase [Opitutaceae bacterium]